MEVVSNDGACVSLSTVDSLLPSKATSIIPIIKHNLRQIYLTRPEDTGERTQSVVNLLNITFAQDLRCTLTE